MVLLPAAAALAGALIGLWSRLLVVRHSVPEGEPPRRDRHGCAASPPDPCDPDPCDPDPCDPGPRAAFGGRCRRCSARSGPPPFTVEAVTGLVLAALAWRAVTPGPAGRTGTSGPPWTAGLWTGGAWSGGAPAAAQAAEFLALCWLAGVCVVLAFVDAAVRRLPDRLTLAAGLGTGALLTVAAAAGDRWDDLLRAGLGGLALTAFYLLLFLVNPAGMGLGDVKLAAGLGVALGWLGWGVLVGGTFLGFLAGGVYGVALLVTRRAGRRSEIPFGPFMVLGTFAAILAAPLL
ncbi:prepilin peptidase [Streptosporangium sp. NPDC048047]|uniref:prepilin peptidase n=1 Tax=Streptosporangium sp. NPDC048047 TaxID=3155748 RepID=UPI003414CAFB